MTCSAARRKSRERTGKSLVSGLRVPWGEHSTPPGATHGKPSGRPTAREWGEQWADTFILVSSGRNEAG